MNQYSRHVVIAFLLVVVSAGSLLADGAGQADLDTATKQKLRAKSADDLIAVAALCESAIEAGLSEESEQYARSLWVSCLYERAFAMSRPILDARPVHPQWRAIRRLVLAELEKAIDVDENIGDVHLLVAQLESLPGGNRVNAFESASQAVELYAENPQKLAKAYVIRGSFQSDLENVAKDFELAIKADPRNQDAWRAKAVTHAQRGETDKAIEAFQTLLEINPMDAIGNQALAGIFTDEGKIEKAMELLDKAIEANVTTTGIFLLKADILSRSGKYAEAAASLTKALEGDKKNNQIRLALAQTQLQNGDVDLAQEQLETILKSASSTELRDKARILRSIVYSVKSQLDDAIRDIRIVLKRTNDAGRPELLMYLTRYYTAAERPSKVIESASEVLELDENAWEAYRYRGDAFLSLGKHKEAIRDYESAQQINDSDSGILNNLAWVLATSPVDEVRDGERAVEFATKACDVTEFKKAHIISTLAAAHAENGNFEKAVEWSTKAVEMDAEEEQLANELASYKEKKPWRELQKVEEKQEPDTDSDFDEFRIAE
ncbi:tetratricopeptide repeat protein [Planctomycetota bacterium]